MVWRLMLSRAASRNLPCSRICNVIFANLVSPSQSTHSSSWVFPQISGLCENPRFFSQHSAEDHHFKSQLADKTAENSAFTGESHEEGVPVHSSVVIDDYDNAQMSNVVHLDRLNESFAESLEENGSVKIDASPSGFDLQEKEEEVYEIDGEKLETVLSLLQSSNDGFLEISLERLDLILHEEFVIKVCETPFVLGENLIRFFRWAWEEKSFKVTTRVMESLALAICNGLSEKEIYSLWDLVKDIGKEEDGILNVEILNELIISLSKLRKGKAALEVFNIFEELGCVPNVDTYYYTIEALCRRSCFDWAWSVCQKMLDAHCLPDGEKVGKIISGLCKGRRTGDAHAVYVAAMEKKQLLPMSSVNILIGQLCQKNETVQLAFEMLNDIPGELKVHAIKPFSTVIHALCRIKNVDAARQLILKMIAEGPPPGNAVFNSIITCYCKVGEMAQALELVKMMENRGLKPDVYTYTVIISGYSNGGQMEEAWDVFKEAKRKHPKLSPVTYHSLIRGYCKLEHFDKAMKLLAEMKHFGVQPTADEYEKLIQSLCLKALDWEMAEKLQEEMKENGLYLKGITRALIRAVKDMENETAVEPQAS
ncbi:hypothetical protein L6164_037590 [Bauhinia variegata]|uniref:Uncharacterized protein n=1 Tax=Bauhinia variegata TaxID=167791 RepID=A0ACB9KKJ5_BAUVA|nr:hypothetical protein L6164_037590 [Bauhinia variegata]